MHNIMLNTVKQIVWTNLPTVYLKKILIRQINIFSILNCIYNTIKL